MEIPSEKQCYQIMAEMGMMDHIVAHSEQVCRVAQCLTRHLIQGGVDLDRELIQAAALLHDVTKTRSFETKENHAQTGYQFLVARGFQEVGQIVAQHVRLDTYFSSDLPAKVEVINYADKRVLHDRIVSLQERMDYILERYGSDGEYHDRILRLWDKSKDLEQRIFGYISFGPQDLKAEVEKIYAVSGLHS